ncbi:MAG: Do family serine endopeptidase [Myxococcales bacterium]|nr:Do family serine endopeptidase [Myxococcales bacterium]
MARNKILGIAGLWLCLACSSTAATQRDSTAAPAAKATPGEAPTAPRSVAVTDFRRQFVEVAKTVRPAVVAVTAVSEVEVPSSPFGGRGSPFDWFFRGPSQGPSKRRRQGMGSGVIVDAKGTVLTNNHVVADADELKVVLHDDRELGATLVGTDPKTDLAIIQIKPEELGDLQLQPAALGDSDTLEVGEWVMAIGAPFGLKQTVSAGIVSAVGRGNVGIADYEDFVQTDAAINPGNSGGPLVSLEGRVIGINTAIASRSGGNQGIGFAIPVNMAKAVMEQLMNGGKVVRGYLGVYIADLERELSESFGYRERGGVLIQDVAPDGAAAKAGLKAGDIVIERDGKPVEDAATFRIAIAQTPPGTKVGLLIFRDGKRQKMVVTLGTLPGQQQAQAPSGAGGKGGPGRWGLGLQDLDAQLRKRFEIEAAAGAVVVEVRPDSPAARAGLRPGDVLLQVQNQKVDSAASASKLLAKANAKKTLRLRVLREGRGLFLIMPPAGK